MAKQRLFTVGVGTQFIGHRADKKNYFPGDVFNLDHLNSEQIDALIAKQAVAEVTGMKEADIKAMVDAYKPFLTQEQVYDKMREAGIDVKVG